VRGPLVRLVALLPASENTMRRPKSATVEGHERASVAILCVANMMLKNDRR
jgi:hypothetical protein